jgi:hypothetical protein
MQTCKPGDGGNPVRQEINKAWADASTSLLENMPLIIQDIKNQQGHVYHYLTCDQMPEEENIKYYQP